MKNTVTKAILLALTESIKSTSFVGLKNYTTARGEVANYTLLIGTNYENCMLHDFNALVENQMLIFNTLEKDFEIDNIEIAYKELYDSLEIRLSTPEVKEKLREEGNATMNRSDAQNDAYTHIGKGLKVDESTGELHIYGVEIDKTIVTPAPETEAKKAPSKQAEKTIIKNKITKLCNFRQSKLRTFKVSNLETLNIQGFSITKK